MSSTLAIYALCREAILFQLKMVAARFFFFFFGTMGVSHCGLAIYIKKHLKAKEELWKLKYFSPCKNIIFEKIL
jgi:hypothetical protein